MLDPYRMVVVNVVISLIVISAFFVYKYIKPRKTPPYPLIIFILSLLPLISLLRRGTYESGDLWIHIVRLISFYDSLKEGILIPNWAGSLNATFGYPIFIFDAPLQYYVSSFFHFFGISFIGSIKLSIAVSFIFSGFAMYLWAKNKFGKTQGLVAAIFYMYAPYHLVNMHFRVSVGELILFSLVPLALFSTDKLFENPSRKWLILNSVFVFFMIISSPTVIIALTFFAFYFIFVLYKNGAFINLAIVAFSYVLGLFLSAFYWIPILFEGKFTHQIDFHTVVTFQLLSNLLYKSYMFGFLYQGHRGELSFIIGFVQLAIIVIGFIFFRIDKVKKYNRILFFFLISLLTALFLITPYSKFVWDYLPIYNNLQFSYRILLIVSFMTASIAAIVSTKINNKLIFLLCFLAISSTILNWGNRKVIPSQNDNYFLSRLPFMTNLGEGGVPASPKWTDPEKPWQSKIPKKEMEVISGKTKIQKIERSSTKHSYIIKVTESSKLKENTLYFPGWMAYANGKSLKIYYENPFSPGILTVDLTPGIYKLDFYFTDTLIRKIAKTVSAVTFIILIGIYLVSKRPIRL